MTENQMTESINELWTTVKLGDVILKIIGGGTPSKSVSEYFDGPVPFMTVKDLKSRFPTTTVDSISETALKSSATSIIEADTVIVATRMALGKIARPAIPVAINQDLKAIYFSEDINKTYFEYWWKSSSQNIESLGTGTTVKGIRLENIYDLDFPLPPLAEQVRIADKLDALLARVEAGRERLERVPKFLKRFRQSVLSAAVSGELTREWRGGGDAGWHSIRIGDVCKLRNGFAYKSSDYIQEGIPILRISDIDGTHAHPSQSVFLPENQFDSKFAVVNGDILIAMSGATTGKIGVYKYDRPSLQNQRVGNLIITHPDKITAGFRNLAFSSMSEEILSKAYGGAQPNISSKDIENQTILLPTLPEQAEIVRRVEALFAIAERIEAKYAAALSSFDRLTPALLAKAFRGELVPQDPNDEPASVLLDRIRAAREAEGGKRGRGRPAKAAAGGSGDGTEVKRRGHPPRANAQAGAEGTEPKRRGRPPKVREAVSEPVGQPAAATETVEASAAPRGRGRPPGPGIPQASSFEDALRKLEEQKLARAQGARQVGLFDDAE